MEKNYKVKIDKTAGEITEDSLNLFHQSVDTLPKNLLVESSTSVLALYDADTVLGFPNSDPNYKEPIHDPSKEVEVILYRIGGRYGYRAFMNPEDKKVYYVDYDEPRTGGIISHSTKLGVETDYSSLKKTDINVYNRIQLIKEGREDLNVKYSIINDKGKFGSFEKWELDYPINKIYLEETLHPKIIKIKNCHTLRVWMEK